MNEEIIEFTKEKFNYKVINSPNSDWGYENFWNLFVNSWEPFTLKWIKDYSDFDKSFLDIGAWIGPTTIWSSKFYKSIYSFEPDPISYSYLAKNVALNCNNVNTYNAAINSDGNDIEIFSRSGLGSSMTSMSTGEKSEGFVKGFSLTEALNLYTFALIKIDIEGGERFIIDSLIDNLKLNPIDMIFSLHGPFYKDPKKDYDYILSKLKEVYCKFTLDDGNDINLDDASEGFMTILCSN